LRSNGTRFDVKVHDNVYLGYSHHSTAEVSYGDVKAEALSPGARPKLPPQSAAERRAERKARTNPSATRPVKVIPVLPQRGPSRTWYSISWRARLNGGAYALRIRGPGCAGAKTGWLEPQRLHYSRRGHILGLDVAPPGKLAKGPLVDRPTDHAWCRGTYKVDVAWADHGRRYPPFGTGTFVVR
jgi:hypothetical protein